MGGTSDNDCDRCLLDKQQEIDRNLEERNKISEAKLIVCNKKHTQEELIPEGAQFIPNTPNGVLIMSL